MNAASIPNQSQKIYKTTLPLKSVDLKKKPRKIRRIIPIYVRFEIKFKQVFGSKLKDAKKINYMTYFLPIALCGNHLGTFDTLNILIYANIFSNVSHYQYFKKCN
ncbi:hypothetical protein BpHYR1_045341 [Brachionus plicatilis]|uniref:Uncharacterized protein n=1 Tax=Brachionus plicatilis TaxID=10195 RepID=A0A3M7SRM5_BRAPC|nr:hypothetical protein BpHYR1_045341 [Brachionus plicatilis]